MKEPKSLTVDEITRGWETKDSGKRASYESGMVRDTNENKARYDLMIPKGIPLRETLIYRFAMLLYRGSLKYAARNWEQANSEEELDRFKESSFRHYMAWYCNEKDEDHGAAVLFNINAYEATEYKMSQNKENNK